MLSTEEAKLVRAHDRLESGMRAKLLEYLLHVTPRRVHADAEALRDTLDVVRLRQEREHLALSGRELGRRSLSVGAFARMLACEAQQAFQLRAGQEHLSGRRPADRAYDLRHRRGLH